MRKRLHVLGFRLQLTMLQGGTLQARASRALTFDIAEDRTGDLRDGVLRALHRHVADSDVEIHQVELVSDQGAPIGGPRQ